MIRFPPKERPARLRQYLEVLKDAMGVHLYFPQANASNGLEVFREIEMRNSRHPDSDLAYR